MWIYKKGFDQFIHVKYLINIFLNFLQPTNRISNLSCSLYLLDIFNSSFPPPTTDVEKKNIIQETAHDQEKLTHFPVEFE